MVRSASLYHGKTPVENIGLTDLSDVTVTNVQTDDFLKYSGSEWVNFDLFGTANTWTGKQTFTADIDLGTDGGGDRIITIYSDGAGQYQKLFGSGTGQYIKAYGTTGFIQLGSASSYTWISAGPNQPQFFDAGGTFFWRDRDAGNANRMTLNSATGDLTTTGDINLATGKALNWDSSDVTLTHSAGVLTFAGGHFLCGTVVNMRFRDSGQYINSPSAETLDIVAATTGNIFTSVTTANFGPQAAVVIGGYGTVTINDLGADYDTIIEGDTNANCFTLDAGNDNITVNAAAVSANYDLGLCGDGVLMLKETSTPTADTNYGKVYCKNDDKLYFQDGAGVEHEVAFV